MLNTIRVSILVNVLCLAYGLSLLQQCGKSFNTSQPDWRIVGGADAAVGEFPWQIILTLADKAIVDANAMFCGGTIINERWILTAGHCIHLRTENSLRVRLGVHNFKIQEKDKEVDILVEKIIPHENFTQNSFAIVNDIALVKLSKSLDFSEKHKHLSPICLARSITKLTNKCIASGFGFINHTDYQLPINGVLQKVDLPFAESSLCRKYFKSFNEDQTVCAGGLVKGGKGICGGDSGGPLQCQAEDGRWHQVGITSYGRLFSCASPNIPDVFTKVSAYVDWIENTISNH